MRARIDDLGRAGRSAFARYGVAVLATALGAAGRLLLDPYLGDAVLFVFFYPAVVLAGWYGGLGPGFTTLLLSIAAADWLFVDGTSPAPPPSVAFAVSAVAFACGAGILNLLIAWLAVARRRGETTQEELRTVIECVPVGIFRTDAAGRCQFVNRHWSRYTGISAADARGEGWRAAIHPDDRRMVFAAWDDAVRRGDDFRLEYRFLAPDGRVTWVSGQTTTLFENGRRVGYLGSVADITDRREAEDALRDADRRKNEFLAMLGHELRNPLVPIRNAVDILRRCGSQDPRECEARDMIDRQARHMAQLVDDLLDVARITSGKVALHKQPVVVADAIQHAVDQVRPLIEQRGHDLTISPPPSTVRVDADPARLTQILANLLSNAAKYTESGGRIAVIAEPEQGHVVLHVRDSGVGIDPALLPRIFDLFVQGDRPIDRRLGGLGIGLTMVRTLTELHGGQVEARSPGPGHGSEFVVTLPALPPAAPALEARPQPARGADAPLRILLAEDNYDAAQSYRVLLELDGHQVCVAHTGPTALAAAESFAADVALLDIGLPGLDGYALARALRELPQYRHTVLVALSGYGRPEDKEAARAAGFDHHLTKPVDATVLQSLLADVLREQPAPAAVD